MKRQFLNSIFTILSLMLFLISCSDLKKDLPTATMAGIKIHEQGWSDTASITFHGKAIQAEGWDIRPCQKCHGANYNGGTSGESCKNVGCHSFPAGPENCSTCHGFPPPPGVNGDPAGAGAHQIHINGIGTLSSHAMSCQECHVFPDSIYGEGHFTPTSAVGIYFHYPLANLSSGGIKPVPTYDQNTLKCSNTFCHGTWRLVKAGLPGDTVYVDSVMVGASYSPRWNGGAIDKVCGSCHAMPPVGHKSYTQPCSFCHEDATVAAGKPKHINGKIDVYGGVRNFR
jgi:predicted CxxxxCH...CXXCH cytochrome family protein